MAQGISPRHMDSDAMKAMELTAAYELAVRNRRWVEAASILDKIVELNCNALLMMGQFDPALGETTRAKIISMAKSLKDELGSETMTAEAEGGAVSSDPPAITGPGKK